MVVLFSLSLVNTLPRTLYKSLCGHKLSFLLVMYIVNSWVICPVFSRTCQLFSEVVVLSCKHLVNSNFPHPGKHFESSLPIGSEVVSRGFDLHFPGD